MTKEETSDEKLSRLYRDIAKSEADKFDSRLFWFSGGVAALALGYFQATGTLHSHPVLIAGFALLMVSIVSLLCGLIVSSRTSNSLASWYSEKAKDDSEFARDVIQESIEKLDDIEAKMTYVNVGALVATTFGVALIVVYMFMACQ